MLVQHGTVEPFSATVSPYSKFKIALKSAEVRRQYPNLLERFLDFCRFEGLDVEQKSLEFFRFARNESQDEVEDMIIRFVIFQKERVDIILIPLVIRVESSVRVIPKLTY